MGILIDGANMKKLMQLMPLCCGCLAAQAQTNFYTNVTNLWYQGFKTNVLQIAEQRLQNNTNDIAGLLLKMEYDLAFTETATISNSIQRVLSVGATVNTPKFRGLYDELSFSLSLLLNAIKECPIEDLPAEKAKALIIGKPLPDAIYLEALQKDGFFD
jgi:hypothetical protein